jgi:antirestriction protein ArdC
MGRAVKRGEQGILIYAPIRFKQPELELREGPKVRDDYPSGVRGFRTAYVFDVEQTQGRPLPEMSQTRGDPDNHLEALRKFAAGRGIDIRHDPAIAPALGMSTGGRVLLQPGLEKAEEFATLVHELAHELLHHDERAQSLTRLQRETQAEAVSYVVCRSIGLDTNRAAADYIQLYDGDTDRLMESLAAIRRASDPMLRHMMESREPEKHPQAIDAQQRDAQPAQEVAWER